MVIFDQLRISDDGKKLYINIHVNAADYFSNFYLDKLVIKTSDQISEVAPELYEGDNVYEHTFEEDPPIREAGFVLTPSDFNNKFTQASFSNGLLYVYAVCKVVGAPDPCIPCRLDELTTLAVTCDDNVLYQKVMGFTKEMVDSCGQPSQAFVDFILLWNAFKASVETEHWVSANRFYGMLFNKASVDSGMTKNCGCHG